MVRIKILIVEDAVDVVVSIEKELSYPEYTISAVVSTGAEALRNISALLPDVALIELNLRGAMDGIDTAQAIRASFDIPIIYLASCIDDDMLERAKRTEPFGIVFIPFQERELYAAIEIAFFKHWKQHELELAEIDSDYQPLTETMESFQDNSKRKLIEKGSGESQARSRTLAETADRQHSQEVLRASEAKLRTIFDNSPHAFILFGRDGEVQTCNKIARELIEFWLGVQVTEGSQVKGLVPVAEWGEFKRNLDRALEGETVCAQVFVNINHGRWFEISYTPVVANDRQITSVCVSAVDIDAHKKMIDALAASEERLLTEMQSLLYTTAALVSDVDFGIMLDFITTQARYLTNADGAAVLLLSKDKQFLEIAQLSQLRANSQLPGVGARIELIRGDLEVDINNQISNDRIIASMRRLLDLAVASSLLCAPLKVHNEMLGVLLIWSRHERAFVDHDTHSIHLFADQAALAIFNTKRYLQSRQLAIQQERSRLARELHDSGSQSLYSIGMAALASIMYLDNQAPHKLREAINHIHTLSQTALNDMRQYIQDLRSTTLVEKGLGEALRQYCDMLDRRYDLTVDLLVDADLQLSPYYQENLYYIAREALWNVVKHASVTQAKVVVRRESGQIHLLVADKGVGFVAANPTMTDTAGLRGMKERVALLGGIFEIQSGPDRGTEIIVQVPAQR